jgi:carbon starvation protein
MRALGIIVPILCILTIAYRYYSAFIAAKVMALDDSRVTPAHRKYDGANYYPTTRWVLFGHHFAAIAGAGPLVGPVLAAQFGYAPGLIWLVAGVCVAGAVQDYIWLWASTRRGGRSLADIARTEVGPVAGITAAISIFFILIVALAGLGIVVVNALAESAWATFTIFTTIPLALFMGFYMFRWRRGRVQEATILGVAVLAMAVIFGRNVADSTIAPWFLLTKHQITMAMALYTIAASVLPVWMLLTPRAYLSTFMKIGTIAFLVIGVMIINPKLEAPAFSQFIGGGGPVIPGALFPFVFITIACGAISGFHALVSTGTTSKMVNLESDIRPIGYGAMLVEGVVGVVAIITACALHPGDYYAINTPPEIFQGLGMTVVNLPELQTEIGEVVVGRTGGAVSLAVGMAQIFSGLPGMRGLIAYWYHFAIMFEALFILTTVDSGTRIGRFLIQEFGGRVWKPLARTDWLPGNILSTVIIVLAWV